MAHQHVRNELPSLGDNVRVVAYQDGSFWFCPDCVRDHQDMGRMIPVRKGEYVPADFCDSCGTKLL